MGGKPSGVPVVPGTLKLVRVRSGGCRRLLELAGLLGGLAILGVFCGAFAAACPPEDAEGLTVVPGAADYLPDWPRLAFGR